MYVELIKENNIKVPEIVIPKMDETNNKKIESVIGVLSPLISINGIIVDFNDVELLSIDSTGHIPTIKFEVNDYNGNIKKYDESGKDNYIQIQVLPPFDDAYKKINLVFYIERIEVGSVVSGSGTLKVLPFTNNQYKCLGEMSTYDLFSYISDETGLGFGSNIKSTNDKRYINCNYKSYKDILDDEIGQSEAGETMVLDWWIDLWNNLILCNMYDRKTGIDDNLKIWISDRVDNVVDKVTPIEVDLVFNNSPATQGSELNIKNIEQKNNLSKNKKNSQIITIYDMSKNGYIDNQISTEKVEERINYEYRGEQYGEYNYLLSKEIRDHYIASISAETVEIEASYPLLGINRGDQVRVVWYENSSILMNQDDELKEEKDLGWLKDYDVKVEGMVINDKLSGQFMVLGYTIDYTNQEWSHRMICTKVVKKDEHTKL